MARTNAGWPAALVAACALAGCDAVGNGIARMVGAPTREQYAALEQQVEAAHEAVVKADDAKEALEAELAKATKAREASASRIEALRQAQSQLAQQLAGATGAMRDSIMVAMRRIDRDIEAESSQAAAIGATLADVEESIGRLAIERERARRRLDEAADQVSALDEHGRAAVAGILNGAKAIGDTAQSLGVPGAGAIAQTVADGLGGVLLGVLPAAGVALRYRSQRNAGRRAMANTEKHGLERTATDPSVKEAAKRDLAADRAAKRELAAAKAMA